MKTIRWTLTIFGNVTVNRLFQTDKHQTANKRWTACILQARKERNQTPQ